MSSLVRPLTAINHNGTRLIDKKYDRFISYASGDGTVVTALAHALRGLGLELWLDRWEMRIGDDLPAKRAKGSH